MKSSTIKEFIRYKVHIKMLKIRISLFILGLPTLSDSMKLNIALDLCFGGYIVWGDISDTVIRKNIKSFLKNGGTLNDFIF